MFQWNLLPYLRCPGDGGVLFKDEGERAACACGFRSDPVQSDGILNLCLHAPEHPEARREVDLRDAISTREPDVPVLTEQDLAEMLPTISALQLRTTDVLLELGCGSGRYTLELFDKCAAIIAVDFSHGALTKLSRRLPAGAKVALVQADIAQLKTARAAFPVVMSQLTSNLPTAELRECMYRVGANALTPDGRFVFGAHYWGRAARREGLEKHGYYPGDTKIYRYYMTDGEVRAEAKPYFASIATQPVAVILPGTYRLRLPLRPVSMICEKLPILRDFGTNLLCVARKVRAQATAVAWMTLGWTDGFFGTDGFFEDVALSVLDSQVVWSQLL